MQRYIYSVWNKKVYFCYINTEEYDLEQKIDLEIKMRDGTTKLLAACRHPTQTLEAAKNLLTSNERMSSYMAELQRRKADQVQKYNTSAMISHSVSRIEPSRAKVCVSDIRMPLIWKDTDHFKNRGDYRRFAVFCLLKIGTEIYDTAMVNNVDRSMTDITFDDVIVFNHIPPSFDFRLEVYSHVLTDDLSIASTPRKIKKRIVNSVGRTVGRKLASTLKEELNSDLGPKFNLVAHASLMSSDIDPSIGAHDLILENVENVHHQLPLFGHFCCRLVAQPECMLKERLSGYVTSIQNAETLGGRRTLWAQLKSFQLRLYSRFDEAELVMSVPIDKDTKVKNGEPKNSFIVSDPSQSRDFLFVTDNDTSSWTKAIRQHQKDKILWRKASDSLMSIPSPNLSAVPYFMQTRKGSLYDQTPIKDSPHATFRSRQSSISSPTLRSRSSSASSATSS